MVNMQTSVKRVTASKGKNLLICYKPIYHSSSELMVQFFRRSYLAGILVNLSTLSPFEMIDCKCIDAMRLIPITGLFPSNRRTQKVPVIGAIH